MADDGGKPQRCESCGYPLRATDGGRCQECGAEAPSASPPPQARSDWPRFLSLPPMRYQNAYVWLVMISALDIFLTILVLYAWKGHEVNPIAALIIQYWGFRWTVVFKFALIVLVIVICEVVGRMRDRTGWWLSVASIMIAAFPVAYTFALLFKAGPAPIE